MPRPTTSLVAGAFASLLAMSIALVMLSGVTAHAVGECVTTPNLQSQQSGHWYYRVDRATNRKCWFVGQPGTKVHHAPKLKPQPQSSPKPIRQATQVPVPVPAPVRTVAAARTDGDGFLTRWFGDPKPAGSDAAQAQQPVTIGPAARGETEVDEDADPSLTSDMPSVWPVHTAAELAAVSAPPASSFTLAHILAPMAAALALAAIGVLAHIRGRRRVPRLAGRPGGAGPREPHESRSRPVVRSGARTPPLATRLDRDGAGSAAAAGRHPESMPQRRTSRLP